MSSIIKIEKLNLYNYNNNNASKMSIIKIYDVFTNKLILSTNNIIDLISDINKILFYDNILFISSDDIEKKHYFYSLIDTNGNIILNSWSRTMTNISSHTHLHLYKSYINSNELIILTYLYCEYEYGIFYLDVNIKINNKILILETFLDIILHKKYNAKILFIDFFSDDLKNDKDLINFIINKGYGLVFRYVSIFNDDYDMVLSTIKINGLALAYASLRLQNDLLIVSTAVKQNRNSIVYASNILKNDINFLNLAFKKRRDKLIHIIHRIPSLKNNRHFVLKSVNCYGENLSDASDELKNDKIIVLAAVKRYGSALIFASNILLDDYEIVFTAIQNRYNSYKCASNRLKKNIYIKKLYEYLYKKHSFLGTFKINILYHDNYDIILSAVNYNGLLLKYASDRLRNDIIIIL